MEGRTDDIELKNRDREGERNRTEEEEEEETSFTDQKPGDKSILIIDGSNPLFVRPDADIPNVGRNAGVMRRSIIHDKKQFLKEGLGITVNKGDGPNSSSLYDQLKTTTGKNNRINGATYKDKKILFLKDGKMEYSKDKTKAKYVDEFKKLLTRAYEEHKKTADSVVEEQVNISDDELNDAAIKDSIERLESFTEEEREKVTEQRKDLVLSGNEVREIPGVLDGGINRQNITDTRRVELLEIEKNYWNEIAEAEQNEVKKDFYRSVARVVELEQDNIRLRHRLRPESEEVLNIVKEEAENNDLTIARFQRFKKWVRENFGGIAVVAISIAGIITTIVMSGRSVVKRGARATSKFAKAVANIAKKFGPLLSALGTLLAKILTLGAQGIMFLANNLWILALALTYFMYNEYKDRRRRK